MSKSSEYWDNRAIARLTESEKQSEEYIKRIKKIYAQAFRNIDNDINKIYETYSRQTGLDVQKLKELLSVKETDKVWKTLKRQGLDKYIKNNYKSRISRLEQIQAQIYAKAKQIYPKEELENTMCYKGVVNNSYYKSIYDVQMGTGYDFGFNKIDDNLLKAILSERWSSKNYSERIWTNTDILANSVSEIIGGALMSGQSVDKTTKQIRDRFNVAKYYAERLVRTESNYFHNEADAMAYKEMGVDEYVFVATLDSRTSEICQSMDNKKFKFDERKPGENYPPLHPNCRSTTRGYLGKKAERTLKRRARNPITGKTEIINNMSYKEWLDNFKDNDSISKADYNMLINRPHNVINGKNIVGKFKINEKENYSDGGINRVMEIQGYKGVPKIVNDSDFEKYCKESNFFAQRTYGGKTKKEVYDYQRQLYNSNWYIDCSIGGSQYGKGMYCAGVYNLNDTKGIKGISEEMKHYINLARQRKSPYSIVEDITIDKSAKIIKYNDVIPTYIKEMAKVDKWSNQELLIYDNYYDKINKYNTAYQNYITNWRQGNNVQTYLDDYYRYKKETETIRNQFTTKMDNTYKSIRNKDVSTLAVEMGYDIINAEGHGQSGSYTVILNRTKLIIRGGGNYYGQ